MASCKEFESWNGQSAPTERHQKGKAVPRINDLVGKVTMILPLSELRSTSQLRSFF